MLDSRASWARLGVLLLVSSIGGVGMWSVVVTLPAVQAEFGAARAGAALPYAITMLGFAAGGVIMGRAADRFGIARTVAVASVMLAAGYALASRTHGLLAYALVHGVLIGMLGSGALFGPVMADASLWFRRRRGLAVSVAAAGNYVAGAVWPPIVAAATQSYGWRATELGIGAAMLLTVLPLAWFLRARPPAQAEAGSAGAALATSRARLGLSPGQLLTLLVIAGLGCCVAMAMPQVHIVAYCGDLGYGPARGAEMLSLMLGLGIVSRVASGWVADRIGGLPTLLAGSVLQGASLSLFLVFDSTYVAVCDLRAVRPVPGRDRAELRDHRARVFPGARGRRQGRHRARRDHRRHGAGRLDDRRDLRPHRLVYSRLCQRHCLEPDEWCGCGVAGVARPDAPGRRARQGTDGTVLQGADV